MKKEVIQIKGQLYVCQNEEKGLWVPIDYKKPEPSGPTLQDHEDPRVKIPKQPKRGPFGRG